MRFLLTTLTLALAIVTPAAARLGDTPGQSVLRYGQPTTASAVQPGQSTSTKIFHASGLTITCGYVKGIVVMETFTNESRSFLPAEVEALLRTDSQKKNWSPPGPFAGTMSYKRVDGATAELTRNKLEIKTPAWVAALAMDAAAPADTNAAPENPTTEISASTTPQEPAADQPRPTAADVTATTNAPANP